MRWLLIGGGCLGKEAATLDTASMALIDSEGRKSEADPDKIGYIPDDRNIFLENVNPGVTDRGQAIFTVAPDATGFELELGDALRNEYTMYEDGGAYIVAGENQRDQLYECRVVPEAVDYFATEPADGASRRRGQEASSHQWPSGSSCHTPTATG
jgi:hypothetical protein